MSVAHANDKEQLIDVQTILRVRPREISPEQMLKFEGYMSEIFTALGMDITRDATRDTPKRFMKAMLDVTDGYDGDPKLLKIFETECRGGSDCRISQLVQGPVNFFSLCEHHALPVIGHVYVGYIAHEHIIGLSKLVRLVNLYTRRFSVQERIGQQIADGLQAMLQPHGVAVYLEARHLCTQMRGVRECSAITRTTYWRGNYDTNDHLREEFLRLCRLHGMKQA